MKTPTRIYKYQPFSELTLTSLKTQSIYFGSPAKFNDPYDCSMIPRFAKQSTEQLEKFRSNQLRRTDIPLKARKELEDIEHDKISAILEKIALEVFESQISNFQESRGVSCFSETNDNLLMWSHYGGRGTGICLEFDTANEPFTKTRKVFYSDKPPKIDPVKLLCTGNFESALDVYTTKSKHWAYEREWRVIHKEAGTNYTYESSALVGIYFGTEISATSLEIVCLIVQGQNPNVKFYRGSRSIFEYRVNFEEFEYTNYSEAKKRGLVT
jgi:hypothetical protein